MAALPRVSNAVHMAASAKQARGNGMRRRGCGANLKGQGLGSGEPATDTLLIDMELSSIQQCVLALETPMHSITSSPSTSLFPRLQVPLRCILAGGDFPFFDGS
jgi:hypothetical protein